MTADRGHASVEFAMAVAVLLLPVALIVMSFGPWVERRVAAEAAAAEGVRSAVISLDIGEGTDLVLALVGTSGLDADQVRIGWCGADPAGGGAGACSMARASVVEAEVEIWTPLFNTPWGAVGGIWVSGHHAEPIDLYRSLG